MRSHADHGQVANLRRLQPKAAGDGGDFSLAGPVAKHHENFIGQKPFFARQWKKRRVDGRKASHGRAFGRRLRLGDPPAAVALDVRFRDDHAFARWAPPHAFFGARMRRLVGALVLSVAQALGYGGNQQSRQDPEGAASAAQYPAPAAVVAAAPTIMNRVASSALSVIGDELRRGRTRQGDHHQSEEKKPEEPHGLCSSRAWRDEAHDGARLAQGVEPALRLGNREVRSAEANAIKSDGARSFDDLRAGLRE